MDVHNNNINNNNDNVYGAVSLWPSQCKSSPSSPSQVADNSQTKPNYLGCESARTEYTMHKIHRLSVKSQKVTVVQYYITLQQ